MTIAIYAEIDKLRAENIKLKDERDRYRNGQAQLQKICDDLMDVIGKYADERKMLKAEMKKDFEEIESRAFPPEGPD